MAVAIPFIMLGLTALSAAGSAKAGSDSAKAQKADAKFEERQLAVSQNNTMASGERAATEERKQAQLAQSRAIALASGSGAGVSDPTVTNILGKLAGEGEYNALSQLFNAQSESASAQNQINALKVGASATANATRTAGLLRGIGTAGNGAGSFLSKYGESSADAGGGIDPSYSGGLGMFAGGGAGMAG